MAPGSKAKSAKYDGTSCRICLGYGDHELNDLFSDTHGKRISMIEALRILADIKFHPSDGLPQYICSRCRSNLLKAYSFKQLAEKTNKKLHSSDDLMIIIKDETKLNSEVKQIKFDSIDGIKSQLKSIKKEFEIKVEYPEFQDVNVINTTNKEMTIGKTTITKLGAANNVSNPTNDADDFDYESRFNDHFDDDFDDCVEDMNHAINDEALDWQDDASEDEYLPPKPVKTNKKKKPKHLRGITCDIKIQDATKEPVVEPIVRKLNKTVMKHHNKKKAYATRVIQNLNIPISKTEPWDSGTLIERSSEPGLCPECGDNVDNLRAHMVTEHKAIVKRSEFVPKEKEICPICGLMFMHLEKHLKKHEEDTNVVRMKCDHCPKEFKTKASLTHHLAVHMDLVVKSNICNECGAAFAKKGSLERHKLIHKGEKPFMCGICERKFLLKQQLKIHMNIHTGTKPHKCPMCDRCFSTKTILLTHKRVHTGEKPYTCQVCNMAFSYKVNLNNHAEKYHGFTLRFTQIHTITQDLIEHQHEIINKARFAVYKDRLAARMLQSDDKMYKKRRREEYF